MRRRILIVFMSFALLLIGTHAAFAKCPAFGFGLPLYQDLSKEQAERLYQIREKFRSETEDLRREIFLRRLELNQLYRDPNATEEKIKSKQKELSSLLEKLSEKILERRLEERKVLSPNQLKRGIPPYRIFCGCR